MDLKSRIQILVEKRKDLPLLKSWIAENPALQPATITRDWLPQYTRASEAKIILILEILSTEHGYWEFWEITERIKESAYHHRYEGEWKEVQDLLEQPFLLSGLEEWKNSHYSDDDFFGNLIPSCEKFLRRSNNSFRNSDRKPRKARKLVYRRGYKDKGSVRPEDKRGRNLPDPNPGEDLRFKAQWANIPSFRGVLTKEDPGGEISVPREKEVPENDSKSNSSNRRNQESLSETDGKETTHFQTQKSE